MEHIHLIDFNNVLMLMDKLYNNNSNNLGIMVIAFTEISVYSAYVWGTDDAYASISRLRDIVQLDGRVSSFHSCVGASANRTTFGRNGRMAIREWADARAASIFRHGRLAALLSRLTLLLAASIMLLHSPLAVAQQVSLTVRNVTAQPVELVWLDDAGAEEVLGPVDSGQSVTLDAAVGWSFRARQGGQRIAEYKVTGAPGESWEVKAGPPDTATAEAAPHVQVDTGNPGNVPVELVTIEPDGREASLGTLPPGSIGATLTTPGVPATT